MLTFKKFPEIIFGTQRLIWDSRQVSTGGPERVYLNPALPSEVQQSLRSRAGASYVIDTAAIRRLGEDAASALGFPSRQLKIIGVTGTNGKTSCTHIMAFALASLGHRTMQIGTLGVQVWESDGQGSARTVFSSETGFTTPEAPSLHDLFKQASAAGVTHVVMEVSSHAMALDRVSGVEFDGVVFTNLSQDHLDFHGNMQSYGEAKRLLVERELAESTKERKFAVLAAPDETSEKYFLRGLGPVAGVSRIEVRRGPNFELLSEDLNGLRIEVAGQGSLKSTLIGAHNAWNLVVSYMALQALEHITLAQFESALRDYHGTPGRFERVGKRCFVDYAHSPDALEKVLATLRAAMSGTEKLIVVFGCGGDRDRGKRPIMGEIAARLAHVVWLTNDNPRSEDPQSILAQIAAGVPAGTGSTVRQCPDRAQAIEAAIRAAGAGDVVVVCGKGHENYQIIGKQRLPFSDQDCIRKCLGESGVVLR